MKIKIFTTVAVIIFLFHSVAIFADTTKEIYDKLNISETEENIKKHMVFLRNTMEAQNELRDLLNELNTFRHDYQFHSFGFSSNNRQSTLWKEKADSFRMKNEKNQSVYFEVRVASVSIISLAMEWISSKGKDSDMSKWYMKEVNAGLNANVRDKFKDYEQELIRPAVDINIENIIEPNLIQVEANGKKINVVLYGIIFPKNFEQYKEEAIKFVMNATGGRKALMQTLGDEKEGHAVAVVSVDNFGLNEAIVNAGYASIYNEHCQLPACDGWIKKEEHAQRLKKGIWKQ